MRLLEELLPFAILVAISIAGKVLESRKQKRLKEQAREVPQPPPEVYDEDESYEEEPSWSEPAKPEPVRPEPTRPEPVKQSPMAPPVVAMPEGLRTILRNLGVEVATPPPPPPAPKVEAPVHLTPKPVRKEIVLPDPEIHKPALDLRPEAVRAGILWKTILDEPRAHRPWRPHS